MIYSQLETHVLNLRIQDELLAYLLERAGDHDLAVSLTMKQQLGPNALTEFEAEKNLNHFLNRLGKKAYGNATSRHGRKVPVVSMLERSLAGRWHHHLTMKNPFPGLEVCHSAIAECWSKTRWGYNEIYVVPIYDIAGWYRYTTKSQTSYGWDMKNTHLVR